MGVNVDLILYLGECAAGNFSYYNRHNLSRGRQTLSDFERTRAVATAEKIIWWYLEPENRGVLEKELGWCRPAPNGYYLTYAEVEERGLVETEEEAKQFIEYVKQTIPNTEGMVVPIQCAKGTISFDRLLRIKDWPKTIDMLIKILRQGYEINDPIRANMEQHYSIIKDREMAAKQIEKSYDPTEFWRRNIKIRESNPQHL